MSAARNRIVVLLRMLDVAIQGCKGAKFGWLRVR
jgi:hypothetical protein